MKYPFFTCNFFYKIFKFSTFHVINGLEIILEEYHLSCFTFRIFFRWLFNIHPFVTVKFDGEFSRNWLYKLLLVIGYTGIGVSGISN